MLLEQIVRHKKLEVDVGKTVMPLPELAALAAVQPPALNFASALKGNEVKLITEIKKASPSRAVIRSDFDPVGIARLYSLHGAAAMSVLTETNYFQGRLEHLTAVKGGIDKPVPVLRKDFIFDPYQVYETRAAGADALLLIVAILKPARLKELVQLSCSLGMAALVEVHDAREVDIALESGARIIGINNRDLDSLEIDLETTCRLSPLIPAEIIVVSESGIRQRSDIIMLARCGVDACLVGEVLMSSSDIPATLEALLGKN